MNPWIAFGIGVFVGAVFGVIIMAVMNYNREE